MSRREIFVALTLISMSVLSACGSPTETVRATPSSPAPGQTPALSPAPSPSGAATPTAVNTRTVITPQSLATGLADAQSTATALAGTAGIYRYDIATHTLAKISEARAHVLAWLPDGKGIWYSTALPPSGSGEIRRLDLTTGNDTQIVAFTGGLVDLAPAVGRAVFSSFRKHENGGGYTVNAFDQARGGTQYGEGSLLKLAPDGSTVAYRTPSCAEMPNLKVVDLDRGEQITLPDIVSSWYEWMPDGRLAVRTGSTAQSSGEWHVLDLATGASTRLLDLLGSEAFDYFTLSPDGRHAVLITDRPEGRVAVRDVVTGYETEEPVWPRGWDISVWAPDSKHVAFVTSDALLIASSDGTIVDTVKLPASHRSNYHAHPQWSPDSSSIVFSFVEENGFGMCD